MPMEFDQTTGFFSFAAQAACAAFAFAGLSMSPITASAARRVGRIPASAKMKTNLGRIRFLMTGSIEIIVDRVCSCIRSKVIFLQPEKCQERGVGLDTATVRKRMGVVALAVPSQLGAASPSAGDSRRYNDGSVKMRPAECVTATPPAGVAWFPRDEDSKRGCARRDARSGSRIDIAKRRLRPGRTRAR